MDSSILLADIRRHVNVLASHGGLTHGKHQPNSAWVERSWVFTVTSQ